MAELADIGIVGLGAMGANLALNLAENGFRTAVFDRQPDRRAALASGDFAGLFVDCGSEQALLAAIRPPRPVIFLIPAGKVTDAALKTFAGLADPGDLLIDAGNSDFHDTRRRTAEMEAQGLGYLGIGVSGGAEGARTGPALMAGGSSAVWDRVAPIFGAIAARYRGEPCVGWVGPDGAGHFVKTVHNGIEYADMQMIAEIYGLMRDGLQLDEDTIAGIFRDWSFGPLASYLVEITAEVAAAKDPKTGKPLLQVIADRAGQKGTGRWSVIEAQRLGVAVGTIEAAVGARNLSAATGMRARLASDGSIGAGAGDNVQALKTDDLGDALLAGKIIAYAQGFNLLAAASSEYGWGLNLGQIARIWRAGCIIRSPMLDDIATAFDKDPDGGLLAAPVFRDRLSPILPALRRCVAAAVVDGLPAPALANALAHLDQLTRPRGTANLLQGQRDFFGQHGFERTDRPGGGFHGPWGVG